MLKKKDRTIPVITLNLKNKFKFIFNPIIFHLNTCMEKTCQSETLVLLNHQKKRSFSLAFSSYERVSAVISLSQPVLES